MVVAELSYNVNPKGIVCKTKWMLVHLSPKLVFLEAALPLGIIH